MQIQMKQTNMQLLRAKTATKTVKTAVIRIAEKTAAEVQQMHLIITRV